MIEGEAITVTPRVALTLALALHELTTNAAKYGALSVPAGRIDVRWRIVRRPSQPPLLRIEWRERGGPPVAAADAAWLRLAVHRRQRRRGAAGHGTAGLRSGGLRCTMEIPVESAVVDVEAGTA